MDPSFSNWGLAAGMLDLETGYLDITDLTVVTPLELKGKQVRKNSQDLHRTEQLAAAVLPAARQAKVIFVESPVGSQSARAMASYGVCLGILGAIRAEGINLIEVTATEVKLALTSNPNATKAEMIAAATSLYPDANFPTHRGKITAKAEHVADGIAAIHAGVNTPVFQNIMRVLKGL